MRKRAFSLALVFCMVLALLPVGVQAAEIIDSGSCGEDLTWTLDSSGLLTISGSGKMKESSDSNEMWDSYNEQIQQVVIEPGATSIAPWAFSSCDLLTSVTIPESVTHIGEGAFYYDEMLTEIALPSSLKVIGQFAFRFCKGLQSITIPEGVAWIYNRSFEGCSGLNSISFPSTLIGIDTYAFSNCDNLQSVDIPNSVTTIEEYAFNSCDNLRHVTLSTNITELKTGVLGNCTSLEELVIPSGVTAIGNHAGSGCTSMKTVFIPSTVCTIDGGAFGNCISLETVQIEDLAAWCAIDYPGNSLMYYAHSLVLNGEAITNLIIPDGVSEIKPSVFRGFSQMQSVTIPGSVTTIGLYAFHECSGLTDVFYIGSIENWNKMYIASCNDPLLNARIHCTDGDIGVTCQHVVTTVTGEKAATCSEPGYTGDTVCQDCGEIIQSGETIPTTPHTWSAWVTTVQPTETAVGFEVRTCLVCGASETKVIPKLEPAGPFIDVPAGAYYHDAVLWAYGHEPQITTGVTDNTFVPDKICTRAQVVAFLWRAAGEPEPKLKVNPFRDVSASAYYYKAVLWALENGVTTGITDTTFNPTGECTRAQAVTFLWRAAGEPAPESMNNPFSDVSSSAYYCKAVLWAREQGITTGNTPTTFNPTGKCTRAHVVTFLYRAFGE